MVSSLDTCSHAHQTKAITSPYKSQEQLSLSLISTVTLTTPALYVHTLQLAVAQQQSHMLAHMNSVSDKACTVLLQGSIHAFFVCLFIL